MKKLCIVPFTAREIPLLDLLKKQYSIESLVSPKGIGLDGEDVSVLINCQKIGSSITNEVNQSIKRCDTVIVTEVEKEMMSFRTYALTALRCAIDEGKEVYCYLDLEDNEKKEMEQLCKDSGAKLIINSDNEIEAFEDEENLNLFKFETPILYFCEEVPDCDGYSVFLKLTQQLQDRGKSVLAVSSDRYNELIGQKYLNFDAKASITSQLYRINFFVHDLEQRNHPDIIFIKLPYPLMRYNDENVFDCGVSAFLTAQAVPGDGCIYCSHAAPLTVDVWDTYSRSILTKFGYPIVAVHISNRLIDNSGNDSLGVVRIPQQEILKRLDGLKYSTTIPFYHLLINEQIEELGEYIISEFLDLPYGVIK